MGLNAPFGEMENRPGFERPFGDTKCSFHNPQAVILLYYLACREVCVGDVTFETVPLSIGGNLFFIDADQDIVLNCQEFVVAALIDVALGDFARGIGLAQTLIASASSCGDNRTSSKFSTP